MIHTPEETCLRLRSLGRTAVLLTLLTSALLCTGVRAQTTATSEKSKNDATASGSGLRATHVLGLEGVKRNANGTLTVQPTGIKFESEGAQGNVTLASIQDVFTGQDSRQTGGMALTLAKIAVPYGGGRVISLFSHEKFDSLTLTYRDANNGLHGAIFTMSLGQATALKQQLVALGAKTSIPVESQGEEKGSGGIKK